MRLELKTAFSLAIKISAYPRLARNNESMNCFRNLSAIVYTASMGFAGHRMTNCYAYGVPLPLNLS